MRKFGLTHSGQSHWSATHLRHVQLVPCKSIRLGLEEFKGPVFKFISPPGRIAHSQGMQSTGPSRPGQHPRESVAASCACAWSISMDWLMSRAAGSSAVCMCGTGHEDGTDGRDDEGRQP